jgi:nucleotide-binding universal stress UspA family protein
MSHPILVPLDGSTFGEHALPLAMNLARRTNASVHLIHVHSLLDATYAELQLYDNSLDLALRSKEHEYLHKIQEQVQNRLSAPVTITNVDGDVAAVLRERADSLRAGWIVMTTHARGPLGRFWLGSVTDELVRSLSMPLVLVHPHDHPVDLNVEETVEHLLIPLDGTPLAEGILEPALAFGKLLGCNYTLLRVVTPAYPVALPADAAYSGSVEKMHAGMKEEAARYLDAIATRLHSEGLKVRTCVIFAEQPGVAILENAKPPIDMIAIETHGRGGLSRLLMGSVADKVIRGSKLPILVCKPKV